MLTAALWYGWVVWPDLHVGFGTLLASGFVGGHGTAAAVGATFAERGWPQAGSLAMTAATVGILSSIVGGMAWIQWGARRQATRFVARFEELPAELRTGLIPQEKRKPFGYETKHHPAANVFVVDNVVFKGFHQASLLTPSPNQQFYRFVFSLLIAPLVHSKQAVDFKKTLTLGVPLKSQV